MGRRYIVVTTFEVRAIFVVVVLVRSGLVRRNPAHGTGVGIVLGRVGFDSCSANQINNSARSGFSGNARAATIMTANNDNFVSMGAVSLYMYSSCNVMMAYIHTCRTQCRCGSALANRNPDIAAVMVTIDDDVDDGRYNIGKTMDVIQTSINPATSNSLHRLLYVVRSVLWIAVG